MFRSIYLVVLWVSITIAPAAIQAKTHVAVAANFVDTAERLGAAFGEEDLSFVSGASGKLYAQIINGAPFALFLSADTEKPLALIERGVATAKDYRVYAHGRLALWSRRSHPPENAAGIYGYIETLDGKIALANPKLAPYGRASIAALRHLNLSETRTRWVMGENITQAYQFVFTGNAETGFAALSQVMGRAFPYTVVPSDWHPPIEQAAVLLNDGEAGLARRFFEFLKSPDAAAIIEADGYLVPSTDHDHH